MADRIVLSPNPKLAAVTLIVTLCSFASPQYVQASGDENQIDLHILNRLTFGPREGDLENLKKIGRKEYIDQQLHPEKIHEAPTLTAYLKGVDVLNDTPAQLFRRYGPPAAKLALAQGKDDMQKDPEPKVQEAPFAKVSPIPEPVANLTEVTPQAPAEKNKDLDAKQQAQKQLGINYRHLTDELLQARLRRAIYSRRQLEEVMTEFWYNHFNVSVEKGLDHLWAGSYEEQAIRPNALGNFRQLLGATCHHAAMLFYLDNWQNTAPNAQAARGRFKGLNENYARELMELHTLGVDGGYTQEDVIALAHILTGLGTPPVRPGRNVDMSKANPEHLRNGAYFDERRHDFGDKVFLGHKISGKGEAEIDEALDILCAQPATAHHISFQLAQFFVADNPPKALVDRLAKRFTDTKGDIRQMLSTLFESPEFNDPQYFNNKFKTPFQYVVSSIRASGTDFDNLRPVIQFVRQLGMPMYAWLTPDGYKNTREAWLNPDAMLRRINFATGLGTGHMPQNDLQACDYKSVLDTVGPELSLKTKTVVDQSPETLKAALILGSPEFMTY